MRSQHYMYSQQAELTHPRTFSLLHTQRTSPLLWGIHSKWSKHSRIPPSTYTTHPERDLLRSCTQRHMPRRYLFARHTQMKILSWRSLHYMHTPAPIDSVPSSAHMDKNFQSH
jgi:hypothetical protein